MRFIIGCLCVLANLCLIAAEPQLRGCTTDDEKCLINALSLYLSSNPEGKAEPLAVPVFDIKVNVPTKVETHWIMGPSLFVNFTNEHFNSFKLVKSTNGTSEAPARYTYLIKGVIPRSEFNGPSKIKGTVFHEPIEAKGLAEFVFFNAQSERLIELEYNEESKRPCFTIKNFQYMTPTLDNCIIRFYNLFDSKHPEEAEKTSRVLQENCIEYLVSSAKPINKIEEEAQYFIYQKFFENC